MESGNTSFVADTLNEAAARVEQMPFCSENEAVDRERTGRSTILIDHLIRAGIRESIAILKLEKTWLHRRRHERPSSPPSNGFKKPFREKGE